MCQRSKRQIETVRAVLAGLPMALEEPSSSGGLWDSNSAGNGGDSGARLEGYDLEQQFGRCAACRMATLGKDGVLYASVSPANGLFVAAGALDIVMHGSALQRPFWGGVACCAASAGRHKGHIRWQWQ